jgi:hypothetical protein
VPDTERRLLYLRVAIAAGTLASMILSHALWVSTRFYPLTPVFAALKPIPSPFDHILFYATLLALVLSAISRRWIPFFATFAIVLVVCDQSRLQPWFYEYFFLLLGIAFASPNACRIIMATTYFWSGAQKLNAGFINDVFPAILDPFLRHLPHAAQSIVHPLSVAAPFIELWIGIALLGRKFRTPAVVVAIAMHVFILIALSPDNHVMWPWNIAMIAALVILFWKTEESARHILLSRNAFHIAALLLFAFAPALSFFGRWDHYLSAAMYSSNTNHATIFITKNLFDRLPDGIGEYAREETPDIDSIDIAEWSAGELNVPPYPEVRIYKSVARKICEYAQNPTEMRLSVTSKSTVGKSITGSSYTCSALKGQ